MSNIYDTFWKQKKIARILYHSANVLSFCFLTQIPNFAYLSLAFEHFERRCSCSGCRTRIVFAYTMIQRRLLHVVQIPMHRSFVIGQLLPIHGWAWNHQEPWHQSTLLRIYIMLLRIKELILLSKEAQALLMQRYLAWKYFDVIFYLYMLYIQSLSNSQSCLYRTQERHLSTHLHYVGIWK